MPHSHSDTRTYAHFQTTPLPVDIGAIFNSSVQNALGISTPCGIPSCPSSPGECSGSSSSGGGSYITYGYFQNTPPPSPGHPDKSSGMVFQKTKSGSMISYGYLDSTSSGGHQGRQSKSTSKSRNGKHSSSGEMISYERVDDSVPRGEGRSGAHSTPIKEGGGFNPPVSPLKSRESRSSSGRPCGTCGGVKD